MTESPGTPEEPATTEAELTDEPTEPTDVGAEGDGTEQTGAEPEVPAEYDDHDDDLEATAEDVTDTAVEDEQ